ncbi:unnamed protein product [Rangifer tarandus platyrhynchus]|uniref:Uncharacterized protein n=1 Tax=Rangifer tarandus platyrhynchus TaxID=3082113 RepID=A0AC59ZBI2_RANTA
MSAGVRRSPALQTAQALRPLPPRGHIPATVNLSLPHGGGVAIAPEAVSLPGLVYQQRSAEGSAGLGFLEVTPSRPGPPALASTPTSTPQTQLEPKDWNLSQNHCSRVPQTPCPYLTGTELLRVQFTPFCQDIPNSAAPDTQPSEP